MDLCNSSACLEVRSWLILAGLASGPGVLLSLSYAEVVLLAAGSEYSVAVRDSAERGES